MGQDVSTVSMWVNITFAITYYIVFFVVHWRMWHKVKHHLKRRDAWEDLALMDDNPNAKDTLMSMNGKATGINKMHHKLTLMRQKMKAKTGHGAEGAGHTEIATPGFTKKSSIYDVWDIDGQIVNMSEKYAVGTQEWYLQDRVKGALAKGHEPPGVRINRSGKQGSAGKVAKRGGGDETKVEILPSGMFGPGLDSDEEEEEEDEDDAGGRGILGDLLGAGSAIGDNILKEEDQRRSSEKVGQFSSSVRKMVSAVGNYTGEGGGEDGGEHQHFSKGVGRLVSALRPGPLTREYEAHFRRSSIGLLLGVREGGREGQGGVFVTEIVPGGQADVLESVSVGDEVIGIDGKNTAGMEAAAVMTRVGIAQAAPPFTLALRREVRTFVGERARGMRVCG
jgi:hypothetical protein